MIQFNKPSLSGNELLYISDAILDGQIAGDFKYSKKCNDFFYKLFNTKALLTTSCTHALELSALLLNIKPGDEIIVPSFTFVSTVNAFVLRGASPVFCDIREDTLNIDENKIEELITQKTKAIIVVHYAGVSCEMEKILDIVKKYNIILIEDNAHGLFGKYKNKWLGTFGNLATQSFHETKNITCGEGGALLINDIKYFERAEIIREKGTNRSKFFRGEIDKYSWVDIGSSYVLSDILAAFLYAQLENWSKIQQKRKEIWNYYDTELRNWCLDNNIKQPYIPNYCDQSYHIYYLIMPSFKYRQKFIRYLKDNNIHVTFHYIPLHSSLYGKKWFRDCKISDKISSSLVRLPLYIDVGNCQETILKTIKNYKI